MKGRVWVSERVHGPAEVNQMSPPDSPCRSDAVSAMLAASRGLQPAPLGVPALNRPSSILQLFSTDPIRRESNGGRKRE